MAYLFSQLINVFTLISPTTMDEFEQQSAFWSLMWTILAIVTGFAYFVLGFVSTHVAHYISSKYRQQYFEGLLYQKTSFFDQEENSTGTLTARVGSDPKQLEELLGMNMAMVYTSFFTLIGSLAIAFAFGWKLALVATAVTAPIGLVAGYFRLSYELEFEKLYAVVFAESSQFAAESISAFRTVTSLTLEDTICTRYDHLLNGHVGKAFKKARWSTFIFAFSDSVSFACQALIFWYGSRLMATREYNVMQFFVCFMAVIQGAEGAGQGFSFGPNAAQASAAANRILSVRESRHKRMDDVSEKKQQQHIPDTEGGVKIELRDVHFKYPTRDTPIFRGLDLTIEKGQFAALVGASGCGKTSIVSLLERFYDIQRGAIFANGVDITDIDVYEYRKYLSLVAQEPTRKFTHTPSLAPPPFFLRDERCGQSALVPTHRIRIRTPGARCFFTYLPTYLTNRKTHQLTPDITIVFQGTLRENILLGVPPASIPDAELHAVCRDAGIHDFIVSLPEGYETPIGSRGVSLSGGQKQRVAIARALVRRPAVLLLDEATSSLDSESERLVQRAFERAAAGRTMVVVAHRLATVQNADVIFVLGEGGKVLEQGSHGDLLRRKGVYWNMVSLLFFPSTPLGFSFLFSPCFCFLYPPGFVLASTTYYLPTYLGICVHLLTWIVKTVSKPSSR